MWESVACCNFNVLKVEAACVIARLKSVII
jgi:hypothetical protein